MAALEERQVLADGVELADGRAGGQQEPRELLLLGERDGRRGRRRQRRAAAGDEKQDEIVRAGAASDLEKPRRGGQPARVGHGMPGFGDLDAPQARAVSVLHDHEAAGDVIAQDLLGGRSHGAARLAGAQEEDAGGLAIEAEVSADERRHVARRQRRFPYRADGVA